MSVWKRKRRLLKLIRLDGGCKRFWAMQTWGTCKTLRKWQCWSQFFEMFLFLLKNISQRSAIVPAMKSNRLTKDLVNNVNLLFTRLLFPRLITLPIRWLERNASRQAIKHSASNWNWGLLRRLVLKLIKQRSGIVDWLVLRLFKW